MVSLYKHRHGAWPVIWVLALAMAWMLTGCELATEAPSPTTSPLPAAPFTSPLPASFDPPWPSGRVLYHSDQGGAFQLYLVDNGQPPVALTQPPGSALEPIWSPDGKQIAFAAYAIDPNNVSIHVMGADGAGKRAIMEDQPALNWRPEWSPDGTQLLFQSNREGNFEIYRVNLDGSSLLNLTQHPANEGDADWSPDGDTILFVSDREDQIGLYTMRPDGQDVKLLLRKAWYYATPHWSPDGKQIAFISDLDGDGTVSVYVMSAKGKNVHRVSQRSTDEASPAWVGNDQLLFAGVVGDTQWDLFIGDADGSSVSQLTDTPDSERFPSWAP